MNRIDSSDVLGFLIAAVIAGFLIWSIFFSKNDNSAQTTATTSTYQPPAQSPTSNYTPPVTQPEPPTDTTNHPVIEGNYQLCQVRIINTLNNTDKTGGYKAIMDPQDKTLRLYYIDNDKEIIEVHYDGGGLNTMRLYRDNILEAEKIMYRRTDLESNSKEIVYTSRTEQIKIIISYE